MKRRAIYEAAAEYLDRETCICCCTALTLDGPVPGICSEFRAVFGLTPYEVFEGLATREGWFPEYVALGEFRPDVRVMALCLAYSVLTYRRPRSRSAKRRFR